MTKQEQYKRRQRRREKTRKPGYQRVRTRPHQIGYADHSRKTLYSSVDRQRRYIVRLKQDVSQAEKARRLADDRHERFIRTIRGASSFLRSEAAADRTAEWDRHTILLRKRQWRLIRTQTLIIGRLTVPE